MRENHFLTLNRALNGAMLAAVLLTYSSVFAAEIAIDEGACLNGRVDMDNAPAVPTIKVPLPGSIEPVAGELSSPQADALLRGS